ncbi:hypothetical protein E4T48_06981 [Aureobasidium sp. EXF-10727]|nr:hypothetical protein E4T48_06981 [Aureobasidium sp. EXF-10727]KAI4725036.1 hypothetical protein E4T49_07214 [Aureobasidium sp. EXF-10728]
MPGTSSPVSPGPSEPPMSFQFVNLTDPSDTKDQKVRRAIRSHVTKQQHQKAEQLAAARRSNSDPQLLGTSAQISQGRAHAVSYPLSRPTSSDQQSPISPTSSSDVSSFSPTTQNSMIDVSQVYPSQWLPYLNQILENYSKTTHNIDLAYTAKQVLQSGDAPTMALLRSVWMPFVMTDVALLHAVLLFAASLFRSSMSAHAQVVDLFQLKDMAIQAMNGNLSTKDSMIATMATMAQYEAFWRDAEAFSTHMSGLRQFVEMRGGLSALGLDGFLQRMLVAIDLDLARTTGHERLFASSRRQSPRRQGSHG